MFCVRVYNVVVYVRSLLVADIIILRFLLVVVFISCGCIVLGFLLVGAFFSVRIFCYGF